MSLNFVIWLVLILFVNILAALVYLSIYSKFKRRRRSRLRRAGEITDVRTRERWSTRNFYDHHHETTQYFLGDISCQNNAHSPYLRCAINPKGPCTQCPYYQKKQ